MLDQANRLRQMIAAAEPPVESELALPPTVVVTGGKGGAGATTVALNLGVALSRSGWRTVLIDAAPYADVAHRAGVDEADRGNLEDVADGRCDLIDALHVGPAGISVLAGRSVSAAAPDRSSRAADRLLRRLPALETQFDALVIDSGSGMTPWSRRLWQRAGLALLVTTPDDTAVIDAYTTIKQSSTGKPATDVRVLVNKCDHASVAVDVQQRIAAACQRFLGRAVGRAPRLPSARDVWNSYGPPLSWDDVASPFGRSVTQLGRFVVDVLSQRRYASAIAAGCNPLALEFSPC